MGETFLLSRCKHLGAPRYHHPVVYVSVKLWGRDPVRGSRSAKTTGSSIQHSRFHDHQERDGRQDATALSYGFPKSVTEEQMQYAKGFEEALEKIKYQENFGPNTDTVTAANTLVTLSSGQSGQQEHQSALHLPLSLPNTSLSLTSLTPNNPLSRPNSGASGSYDSDTYQLPEGSVAVKIKDEPDDRSVDDEDEEESLLSPGGAGVSPIDMETQEKIKLERKRLRNRQAAAKCRKRKLERISLLDDRVAQLKTENTDLAAVVKKMKSSVAALKQEVLDHVNSGCEIRMSDATVFS